MAEQNKDVPDKASGKTSPPPEAKTPEAEPAERPTAKAKPAAKPTPSKRRLGQASESSDPAVHQLLAEQEIARHNDDGDEVKRTQDALAELGYE